MDSSTAQAAFVVFLFLFSIFLALLLMVWLGWSKEERRGSVSPYSGKKMRLGMDVAKSIQSYVNAFIAEEPYPNDNPQIDFSAAAICNETGRIFSNCVAQNARISLDWSFLQKRCQGTYVSWGSLSEHEQAVIKLLHGTLDGFQTTASSTKLRPESVEREYALLAPGPLYVDRKTKIVIGWKKVPGTYFEVLIVHRPLYESIDDTL